MDPVRCISSDSHIIEPPDLWSTRIDPEFQDRAPTVAQADEADWWFVDGVRFLSFSGGNQTGLRFESPEKLHTGARFTQVRPGGYLPEEHLRENEGEGIAGSVLYPTAGLAFYRIGDTELFSAICRGYNDWLAEFCSYAPDRLKGVAMLNSDDPEEAAGELRRVKILGLSGGLIPTSTQVEERYDHRRYEPLWSTAEELGMPLSLHVGAYRLPSMEVARAIDDPTKVKPSFYVTVSSYVQTSIADMIFSGVFDRHPNLHVGTIEHELGWIPHFLDCLDFTYTQRQDNAKWYRFKNFELPSEVFRSNMFCSFQDDDLGVRERERIGIDGLMFGSDYPHSESTFPHSLGIMSRRLEGVPEAEKRKILVQNVSRMYGFSL